MRLLTKLGKPQKPFMSDRPINSTMANYTTNIKVANCQKKRSATLLMNKHADISCDIIALTEPHVGNKRNVTFQRPWNIHCKENNSRAAMITPPWAEAFELSNFSDRDAIFCMVNTKEISFIMGVMYVENGEIDNNIWVPRLDALKEICPRVLIFADSNAHSVLWGYPTSDSKGKKWEEVLAQTNYEVFTDSYATTFCNSRGFSSCIDIAFGTALMKPLITDRVNNILTVGSDHSAWSLSVKSEPLPISNPQLKLKEANWDNVNLVLKRRLIGFQIPDSSDKNKIEEATEKLMNIFQETIEETIQKSYYKPKNRWWKSEFTRLEQEINRETIIENKTRLIRELENKVLKAKEEEWKAFATQCNSVSDAYLKNKIINLEKQDRYLHPIKKIDGTMTETAEETAEVLLKSWFTVDRENTITDRIEEIEKEINESFPMTNVGPFPPVTDTEVLVAISQLKPFSAPGCDGIPPIFFQKTSQVIEPYLTKLFNKCLELGVTPKIWKTGKLVLLPKGKSDLGTIKDYRPITLLPVIVKILERIILPRLQQQDVINNWISKQQFGFQPGKSVTHAVINYISTVSSKLKQKQPTVGIHLDLEGAFNSVLKPILIRRLQKLDCPVYLLNWCHDYMSERMMKYITATASATIDIERSTPQGGSLSPFFWSLIIDPIIDVVQNIGGKINVFADDITIIVSGLTWKTVERKCKIILGEVNKWSRANGLSFNPDKSEYLQFSWQRIGNHPIDLSLNGKKIKRANKVKYLGVIITEKLQWKSHLNYVATKATRNLFKLSSIVNRVWGLKGKYLRTLYLGAIEPILLHACAAWSPAIPKSTLMKPLVRVQRLAARFITGTNNKSHLLDNLMLAGITPIQCRAKELASRWWAGTITDSENPCGEAIEQLVIHEKYEAHFSSVQQLEAWNKQLGVKKLEIELEHSKKRTNLKRPTQDHLIAVSDEEMRQLKLNSFKVRYFTDGSKSEQGVGTAFTRWERDTMISSWSSSLDGQTTNYKAELIAVKNALDDIHDNDDEVAIISDSQAVLRALEKPSSNKQVEETRQKLIRLNRSKNVKIGWTRAHVGTIENEVTDQLAKQAALWRPVNPKGSIDRMELVNMMKNQCLNEWQLLWDSRRDKWSYRWNSKVRKKFRIGNFNNYDTQLLHNFIAGSLPFNAKLNLWKLNDSPKCDFDPASDETPGHFLFECTDTDNLRQQIKRVIRNEFGVHDFTLKLIWKSDECLSILANNLRERFPNRTS